MDKRLIAFMVLASVLFLGHSVLWNWMNPPPPQAQAEPKEGDEAVDPAAEGQEGEGEGDNAGQEGDAQPGDGEIGPQDGEEKPAEGDEPEGDADDGDEPKEQPAEEEKEKLPLKYATLGSANPSAGYKLLVTLTNRGAAVERVELVARNGSGNLKYRDLESLEGYLGHLALTPADGGEGLKVQVVPPGTPAEQAGLLVDDVITAIDGVDLATPLEFDTQLEEKKPGQKIKLTLTRGDVEAKLSRRPLELIKTEGSPRLPFEFTLAQVGEKTLAEDKLQLAGIDLLDSNWEMSARTDAVEFRQEVPAAGVEVVKTYTLKASDSPTEGYALDLDVEIIRTDEKPQEIAYRLYGPSGLPTEGHWYAHKVGRSFFGAIGLRDVVYRRRGNEWQMWRLPDIVDGEAEALLINPQINQPPLDYIGIDGQYFDAVMVPEKEKGEDVWLRRVDPLLLREPPKNKENTADTSFLLTSKSVEIGGENRRLSHHYQIFLGPKDTDILSAYGLSELIYYGWFWFVSIPLSKVLHFFHSIVFNYGIAIILLTVLVRSCMMPISRKQAQSAQMMQKMKPEMDEINKKYKDNPEKKVAATQELYRKYNFNPLAGCLPMLLQFPVFIGLYRALSVDIELRQAPLISESVYWASNLAAPDMLFRWDGFMPEFIVGFLGPYFNVLPVITIGLFLWQQKMFMPPPTDEQAEMQQKMMKYMMVFIGLMFFKVPSGLCIYFITSSLWGVAERKLLGTSTPAAAATPAADSSASAAAGDGTASARRRRMNQKKRK